MSDRTGRILTASFVALGALAFGGILAATLGNPDPWQVGAIAAGSGAAGWMTWSRRSAKR